MNKKYRLSDLTKGCCKLLAVFTLIFAASFQIQAQVPLPEDIIGFEPGENYKLADNEQLEEYYYELAEASDRVELEVIGQTHRGRDLLLLYVSSPENLENREHYRSISEQLARARDLSDDEARDLAEEGRSIVWIDSGLHSAEFAHAQHGPHFVHHMATDESKETERMLDDVILLKMPMMNPDGQEVVVNWYRQQRDTPFEETGPPRVWHEYIDHDNNRDWYMLLQNESRAVADVIYNTWYPQIVVNHHQMGEMPARMFIPPFDEPVNPNIPAKAVRGTNLVGEHMANRFAGEGKSGIMQRSRFDMWWNGGMRTTPYYHNMVGILTESTHRSPIPKKWDFEEDIKGETTVIGGQELPFDEPSVFYPDPWEGGYATLMQMVEYHKTASMGVMDVASLRREQWLYNIYQMGRDAINKGEEGGPYAYIVPRDQWDKPETLEMLKVLDRGGIEIHQATSDFTAAGEEYEAGSYILYTAQAFRAHLVDLMEPQNYPERTQYPGGPPDPPYDMSGWTLPIQMGVDIDLVDDEFTADVTEVEQLSLPDTEVSSGDYYVLSANSNFSAKAINEILREGADVRRATEGFSAGGQEFTPGAFIIDGDVNIVREAASRHGVDFHGINQMPEVETRNMESPRIAKYKSWVKNIDGGWTRWIFDNYGFEVDTLHNDQIHGGQLSDYDILVMPAQNPESILKGHREGTMPEEYVGGLGLEGASQIKEFVSNGGTVVAWDGSTDYLMDQFSLPVENNISGVGRDSFFIPGSLLKLDVDTTHPIAYGMQEQTGAWFVERRGSQSRSFSIVEPASAEDRTADAPEVEVIARYAEEDLLQSGWARGEDRYLAGNPAAVRVGIGDGDIIMIGVRPQFRAQPRATFNLLFNSIYFSATDERPAIETYSFTEE